MKKFCFFTIFCLGFSCMLAAQDSTLAPVVEVSFAFNRQKGFATNQFAVWIEDSRGNFLKTLYATKFTANGGWARRPQSIPLWVSKSGLSTLNKKDIDAFTGATPRTGVLSYRWDGKDKNGNLLPVGEYGVFLEATLRDDNRVLYSAFISLGEGPLVEAETKTAFFGSSAKERGMIEGVRVLHKR